MERKREEMRYYRLDDMDPYWNLAAEEYLFEHCAETDRVFILWQNRPAVVVGKYQNTLEEINSGFVRSRGIDVVRRLSGGGAVYHDPGTLNYSVISGIGENSMLRMRVFCEPVVETLSALGVSCGYSGRNDVQAGDRKVSGSASYRKDRKVLFHGTILFDTDLSVLEQALTPDPEKIISKGIKSVRSRVANLKEFLPAGVSLRDFEERLVKTVSLREDLRETVLTEKDREQIGILREKKYITWEWNFGSSPPFTVRRKRRFENCGTVEALILVKDGRIEDLALQGDFFSDGGLELLLDRLKGRPYREDAVRETIGAYYDVCPAVRGLTGSQLADLLIS